MQSINVPPTNDGEKWVGIVLGLNGEPDYHLIRLPNKAKKLKWKAAVEWAKEQGGEAPTLRELGLLRVNDAEFFEKDWFWSSEQHASNSGFAWYQDFVNGLQNHYGESAELCAVAVRRVAI